MTFGAPQFLPLLIALPALTLFAWWGLRRRAASLRRIGDPALVRRLMLTGGGTQDGASCGLFCGSWA